MRPGEGGVHVTGLSKNMHGHTSVDDPRTHPDIPRRTDTEHHDHLEET